MRSTIVLDDNTHGYVDVSIWASTSDKDEWLDDGIWKHTVTYEKKSDTVHVSHYTDYASDADGVFDEVVDVIPEEIVNEIVSRIPEAMEVAWSIAHEPKEVSGGWINTSVCKDAREEESSGHDAHGTILQAVAAKIQAGLRGENTWHYSTTH